LWPILRQLLGEAEEIMKNHSQTASNLAGITTKYKFRELSLSCSVMILNIEL